MPSGLFKLILFFFLSSVIFSGFKGKKIKNEVLKKLASFFVKRSLHQWSFRLCRKDRILLRGKRVHRSMEKKE